MPFTVRQVVITGAIIAAAIFVMLAALAIVHALQPPVSQASATSIALNQLHQMNPSVSGYTLVSARYNPAPDKVYDDNGNLIYGESRSACPVLGLNLPSQLCHAHAAWVLHFRAPAQGQWATYNAYVVVNSTTGSVSSASLTGT